MTYNGARFTSLKTKRKDLSDRERERERIGPMNKYIRDYSLTYIYIFYIFINLYFFITAFACCIY